MYMDDTALELNRVELSEGTFPKSGNEIAFPEAMLEEYGLTAGIGDEITLPFQLYEEDGWDIRRRTPSGSADSWKVRMVRSRNLIPCWCQRNIWSRPFQRKAGNTG